MEIRILYKKNLRRICLHAYTEQKNVINLQEISTVSLLGVKNTAIRNVLSSCAFLDFTVILKFCLSFMTNSVDAVIIQIKEDIGTEKHCFSSEDCKNDSQLYKPTTNTNSSNAQGSSCKDVATSG
uniref:Uncharacterized protein n=1 Tax=Setaria digitata TaxID=48799 RepID=A0A915Q2L4_9BILA